MSDINDIFERLKGQKPVISNPDELTDLIMDSLPDINEATEPTGARVVKMRWWMAAAASLIIIIGIGTIWMFDNEQPKPQRLTAHHSVVTPTPKVVTDLKTTTKEYGELKSPVTKTSGDLKTSVNTKVKTEEDKTEKQSHTTVISNLHYAVYTPEEDSAYQAPSRMVEFINKIADYNNVKAMPLMCALGSDDSTAVSVAYVFEDNKELNLFSRLLQAACWYESKTPGYLLNFSHQQFFFTLKDLRKNEKYLWIAERIVGGRILLFCSQSPIEADVSSACYQNYREQLMHANYSTSNF